MMENLRRTTVEEIETKYQKFNQVEGVTFVGYEDVIRHYATDDDNAIFTGMYLAAASYRYATDPSEKNLKTVVDTLNGIWLLTNVSGTPGVLARWVFPLKDSWHQIGYDSVKSVVHDNGWHRLIKEGQLYERDGYAFLTGTTRDQIGGVLFGLVAAEYLVPAARPRVKIIIYDLYHRFLKTDWSLEDHEGKRGSAAHRLDAPLKLIVKALYHKMQGTIPVPREWWFRFIWLFTLHYNRTFTRTFSFNLNAMDAHSLLLLSDYHKESRGVKKWQKRIHSFMAGDHNPHFDVLNFASTGKPPSNKSADNLTRRFREPYPKFFSWQKDPSGWWGRESLGRLGPNIDILLPYWMQEYYRGKKNEKNESVLHHHLVVDVI